MAENNTHEFHNIYRDISVSSLINHNLAVKEKNTMETAPQTTIVFDTDYHPTYGLETLGMKNLGQVYRNLPVSKLIEHSVARAEGILASNGALCVKTGKYTGRSPHDKYIVEEENSRHDMHWSALNVPIPEKNFHRLYRRILTYVQKRDLYIFDGYVGADPNYRLGVRIINERASQNLFAHQLFIRPTPAELANHHHDITVIAVPGLQADPEDDGIHSEAFIVLHLSKKLVIIGGSQYAGEIKKSVFSLMNYLMTKVDVLPMHCAANMDKDGNTALFFGLSGTGKTTISADPERRLIGDDEHGWSPTGIFNFEGGCYAKTINLSKENEPQIWDALRFGAMIENVVLDQETRDPDYNDGSLTENTRAAYPIDYIPNCVIPGVGKHPKAVIFLTADAFGVLPPIAKLTTEQAMYHFMSGYTSKVAGTERGITEPQATFSAGFGKCFLPLAAAVYAKMLGDRLEAHPETAVYLVNTGWSGGPYGIGQRFPIKYTRAMVSAALTGQLDQVKYHQHPIFGLWIPDEVPGIPQEVLDPETTWADKEAYQAQAMKLARLFTNNFAKYQDVEEKVLKAGPIVNS